MTHDDVTDEMFAEASRLLRASMLVGQFAADKYRQRLDDLTRQNLEAARAARTLLDREAEIARPIHTIVHDEQFRKNASLSEVLVAYDAALRFSPIDPQAALNAREIECLAKERFGVDLVQAPTGEETPTAADVEYVKAVVGVEEKVNAADVVSGSESEATLHTQAHRGKEEAHAAQKTLTIEEREAKDAQVTPDVKAGEVEAEHMDVRAAERDWDSAEARAQRLKARTEVISDAQALKAAELVDVSSSTSPRVVVKIRRRNSHSRAKQRGRTQARVNAFRR